MAAGKKPRKELDMSTTVIVNYNSIIKVHLSGSTPADNPGSRAKKK
jgi:hypothetical protein